MEVHKAISFLIYLNSDLKKKIRITVSNSMSLSLILSKCKEKFKLNSSAKCILYDFRGDPVSDDDLDYINHEEPLFLSIGEDFSQTVLLALYEKIRTLGEGGFGTVKLYRHRISKVCVAIKFISTQRLVNPEFVSRAYQEIQLLRGLTHPNIVQLIDVVSIPNNICFIMENCEGGELRQYIQDFGVPEESELISLVLQLLDAVRYCHNSNVIHRALKPENIMFKDPAHKHIVIVDFGIAGMFNPGVSGEKSAAGSLLYLAPEVLSGCNYSAWPGLDIWSLGCIIYYMLTGKRLFYGNSRSEIVRKILKGEVPKLEPSRNKWQALIDGMLALEPRKRWDILKSTEYLHKISEGQALEDLRKFSTSHEFGYRSMGPPEKEYLKSTSLRSIMTPEPSVKLPVIKNKKRHFTRAIKKKVKF